MSSTKITYTIERLNAWSALDDDVEQFFLEEAPKISALFDNKFNWENCPIWDMAEKYHFYICRRNGEVRGYIIGAFTYTPLDPKVKIFRQISFYVKEPKPGERTAYHLFQKFIDIGKSEANHIITMLTSRTNIKPSTLEKMGFKELEVLYRLEN